jgi:hypothetical protein
VTLITHRYGNTGYEEFMGGVQKWLGCDLPIGDLPICDLPNM